MVSRLKKCHAFLFVAGCMSFETSSPRQKKPQCSVPGAFLLRLDRARKVIGGVVKIADRLTLLDSLPRGKVGMS